MAGAKLVMTKTTFQNCNAVKNGGGLYISTNDGNEFTNCTFTNNYLGASTSEGGAVEIVGEGSVVDCRFFDNRAGKEGAAIYYNANV